jgi:hypothetical protein
MTHIVSDFVFDNHIYICQQTKSVHNRQPTVHPTFAHNKNWAIIVNQTFPTDLPASFVKHGIICGAVHHPGDPGEYPMFKISNHLADDNDNSVSSTGISMVNNDAVLLKEFWEDFPFLLVEILPKHAALLEPNETSENRVACMKYQNLGYKYPIMQQLMNSQLDSFDKTTTLREIRMRI